ncbi:Phosphoinositide phosphatase SAC8 [Camellia lanceoleosa]|uniref:Phosphoinositide phosphatase SAC8 n=1 Tax=Camellia lanceoleosa TaxID=1840588 RepID=A0ACC0ICS2_9ERIC|nr:Phosphoinositide phosphatase SAC8 [Camellia lanceoleosa]
MVSRFERSSYRPPEDVKERELQNLQMVTSYLGFVRLTAKVNILWVLLSSLLLLLPLLPKMPFRRWCLMRNQSLFCTQRWQRKIYLSKGVDPRFVWNRNILEELIENKLDGFIIPLLQGNILKLFNAYFVCARARMCLCMSTCVRVKGTRMWRRGANLEGSMSSFLQIRGLIPLLWEQIVDLSYKPRLNIIDHEQTSKVVEHHFHDIIERYGETVAVDLTDKHGDEGQLSIAYATEMEKLPNLSWPDGANKIGPLFASQLPVYMREVRTVVYSQFLESYKSVTIKAMAKAFGITVEFIDLELSRFIAAGKLHCKIDKVAGVLETNRPDAKNALYQATIKQARGLPTKPNSEAFSCD